MILRMSQFKIKMDGTDSRSDYLDIRTTKKEDSRMELQQYFLGYQAGGGAIQGDSEYLKKNKFLQQKVGQMIKKAVQSET